MRRCGWSPRCAAAIRSASGRYAHSRASRPTASGSAATRCYPAIREQAAVEGGRLVRLDGDLVGADPECPEEVGEGVDGAYRRIGAVAVEVDEELTVRKVVADPV